MNMGKGGRFQTLPAPFPLRWTQFPPRWVGNRANSRYTEAKGGIFMTELEFAERLKALRKAKNMTQQELADLLGVSNKSVSRWETGGYPDVAMLGPLAKALGVTVDDLLGEAPPLRSLQRADWQNLLSYAFAIGGGVLFFLFDLFTPTLVCYLLYLGAMAYGVYLQRHYTYHSRWFHTANLVMNFFVNIRLVTPVAALLSSNLARLLEAAASGAIAPALWLRAYFPCLLLAAILTLITRAMVRRKGNLELPEIPLPRLGRAAFSPVKLLPILIPILTACFWLLYTMDEHKFYAIFPKWFYVAQDPLFYGLTFLLTVLGVVWLLVKKQRWMLIPMLLMSWGCASLFPSAALHTRAFSLSTGAIFTRNVGILSQTSYTRFATPTPELFISAAVIAALYVVCCFIRFEKRKKTQ